MTLLLPVYCFSINIQYFNLHQIHPVQNSPIAETVAFEFDLAIGVVKDIHEVIAVDGAVFHGGAGVF